MLAKRSFTRGDTLIEVLFAITVLSAAIVGSLAIMNKGTQASIQAVETTIVRQQVDAQIETLRFLNASYVNAYYPGYSPNETTTPAGVYDNIIRNVGSSTPTRFSSEGLIECPAVPNTAFVLNTKQAKKRSYDAEVFKPADTYAQVTYSGTTIRETRGIWIEGVRSTTVAGTGYTDFHIRACWAAPGMNVPRTIGTIVRLYEPRN
jgi:type II secretory pathway pseudopilin PulG